jgi:hypothetical protein
MAETLTATIPDAGSLSGMLDCRSGYVEKIAMPAAWTAAGLTFQACESADGTFLDVQTGSAELALAADAGQCILVLPDRWLGGCYLKVRSGTADTPVAQGAERKLTLKIRAVT